MEQLLLTLHIIGVAVWLGSNIFMGMGSTRAETASAEVNAWWAETQGFFSKTAKNGAAIVVLLTGIAMVLNDQAEFKDAYVSLGFLAVILGAGLGMGVFGPGCRQIAAAYREGDTATAKATIAKLGMAGALESLIVVVTIVAMVAKW